jgi:tetratricopeptide (TPR) repeat protein
LVWDSSADRAAFASANRALELLSANNVDEAIHVSRETIKAFPDFYGGYFALACAHLLKCLGRGDRHSMVAEAASQRAMQINPNSFSCYLRANVLRLLGQREKALDLYRKARELISTERHPRGLIASITQTLTEIIIKFEQTNYYTGDTPSSEAAVRPELTNGPFL